MITKPKLGVANFLHESAVMLLDVVRSAAQARVVRIRTFHDLWAQGIEAGQAELLAKHSASAENHFQLMADVAPDAWWPLLLLAETRSAMGNHKQAIKDLREGIRRGLKNAEVIEKDESSQPLRSESEFQKMLSELTAK